MSEPRESNKFNLDVRNNKVKPTLGNEFESVQLVENPTRLVNIRIELSPEIRSRLIECLQANVDLFTISLHEIPGIDSQVACHQLNMDTGARYVS